MEKVSSGIQGFDKLIDGGFPRGRSYLVAGEPGTGKTIFCLQYLLAGAKLGEKGIYISIDERPDHVVMDAESLGLNIQPFLENGQIQIIDVTKYFSTSEIGDKGISITRIVDDILGFVKKSGATRLAVDPVAPLVFAEKNIPQVAEYIRQLVFAVEDTVGCTTLLTSYVPVGSEKFSQHGIEEFAASGIVLLRLRQKENQIIRSLWVRKMRGTRIDLSEYSFEILPARGLVLRQPI